MVRTLQRYTPHVVVFFGSLGIMIIELVASRLVAKYFGNSLYTWTGVIGVVLGGISLGNYLGGRLADRFEPSRVIIPVLLVSSAATLLILLLDALLGRFVRATMLSSILVLRSVGVITLLFLLPATALGGISPIMAKYALLGHGGIGRTVGNIYAASSIGSIAGTFLAGFVLIPLLDLRIIVVVVGLIIASLGFLIRGRRRVAASGSVLFLLLGAAAFLIDGPPAAAKAGGRVLYARSSQYSYITVKDLSTAGGPSGERVLIMDGLIHNRYDLQNPDHLLYEYETIFESASRMVAPTPEARHRLRLLTLGGGAMTLPSYLARNYRPAENSVVEIDPRVVGIAQRYFAVPRDPAPTVMVGDARVVAESLEGRRSYDIVYLDVFNSFAVPYHLTTLEFTRSLARLLRPNGILLANTIDILDSGGFVARYYNTLRAVFSEVKIYGDPTMNLHDRSTFVLCASLKRKLPEVLPDTKGTPIAFALEPGAVDALIAKNGTALFSDYYAPVDNLMAPVFLRAVK